MSRVRAIARSLRARRRLPRLLGAARVATLMILSPTASRADSTFTVISAADDGSPGTLRWAINQANAGASGTQTIDFSLPSGATITLGGALPMINNPNATININGGGLTIDGNNAGRVFFVASGTVSISNLSVENGATHGGNGGAGRTDGGGGGGGGLGAGGALFVNDGAHVTVTNVGFDGNSAIGGNVASGGVTTSHAGGGGGGGGLSGNGGNTSNTNSGGGGGGGFAGNGSASSNAGGGAGGGIAGNGGSAGAAGGGGGGATTGGNAAGNPDSSTGGSGNSGATGGTTQGNGNGSNGQSPITGGGGGGGGGNQFRGSTAGNGGDGGNGGIGGGGGGGGGGGDGHSSVANGAGGSGGNGGIYAGGGGAGGGTGSPSAGTGGDFGGGGGGSSNAHTTPSNNSTAGAGGFGGGGGGGGLGNTGGTAGFGGGAGGAGQDAGNGGSGLGGAVFVRDGGSLTVVDSTFTNGSLSAGTGTTSGRAAGSALFLNGTTQTTIATNSDTALSDTIAGTGGLLKSGSASITLWGANTYAGPTEIQQGSLIVNSLITSNTTVDSGGTLGGNGTINGNVINNGTIGLPLNMLTINGNYTNTASSSTAVAINDHGSVLMGVDTRTVVNGTATLHGGAVDVQADISGNYTAGRRYVFLEATTITGTYSSITGFIPPNFHAVLGYGDIMDGGIDYETAYFDLVAGSQAGFAAVAMTFNQYGVANYIDVNSASSNPGMQGIINTLNTLTPSQQRAAFDAMTAQVNGTIAQLNVQDTTFLYMMLRRRAGSSFAAGGVAGGSTSGGFASASGSGRSSSTVSLVSNRSADEWVMPCASSASCPTWGGWTAGYGLGGNAGTDGNAAGGVYGSGGTIAAIERPLDNANLIGFFGAYSNLSVRLSGVPQSSSANQGSFRTYYLRDLGRTYFLVAGSAGFAGYREARTMAFGNIDATATGNYSGWNPSVYAEEGARFQLGRTIVQPYGALQYIYVRQNSFTETGAGTLDQSVGGINTHALRGILGSRLAQVWPTASGTAFVPELRAAWMHEFLEPSSTLNAVFAPIGGGSFAAQGLNFGRDWALLGGGTQYVMNQNVSLFANYDLQFNVRQAWNAGSGGVHFAW